MEYIENLEWLLGGIGLFILMILWIKRGLSDTDNSDKVYNRIIYTSVSVAVLDILALLMCVSRIVGTIYK